MLFIAFSQEQFPFVSFRVYSISWISDQPTVFQIAQKKIGVMCLRVTWYASVKCGDVKWLVILQVAPLWTNPVSEWHEGANWTPPPPLHGIHQWNLSTLSISK